MSEDRDGRRSMRPSDVAILCRTRSQITAYADALRHLGIPVQIDEVGWHDAPAVVAARAALAFLTNPADCHAGLRLATLGPARRSLEEALTALREGRLADLPELAPLAGASEDARGRAVATVLAKAIRLAGIEDWAARLPDPAAHLADLARLRAEATTFAGSLAATRAAAGLHGWGARTFLAWLAVRVGAEGGDARPNPSSGEARGVELVTWHAAKGREWPAVLVAGLDWEIGARPREVRTRFEGWEEPVTLLERAGLHRIPDVACKEVQVALLAPHDAAARETERCLAYVAITRARDRLILEWPAWAKSLDGSLAGLLDEAELRVEEDAIRIGDARHPTHVVRPVEALPPGFKNDPVRPNRTPFLLLGRLETCPPAGAELIRRPSAVEAAEPLTGGVCSIGPPLPLGDTADARTRGTALHLAMRVLLTHPDRADALPAATGLDETTLAALASQAEGLRAALHADGLTELHAELPLDATHADGTTTRGIADLLARGVDGRAVVVDFKSPAPDDPMEATAAHAGQLSTYAEALRIVLPGLTVLRCGVLWMGLGVLVTE